MYDLQHEQTPLSFFLLFFNAGWKFLLVQFLRTVFVFAFFVRQVVKKLADARVLCASRRLFVEEAGFDFERAGLFAHGIDAHRSNQPQCRSLHKTANVMTADQRNVFAELLPVQFDQPPPMA